MKKSVIILSILLTVLSCVGGRGGNSDKKSSSSTETARTEAEYRVFSSPQPPSVISDSEKMIFSAQHFWDNVFDEVGPTDSLRINGFRALQFEELVSTWSQMLHLLPQNSARDVEQKLCARLMTFSEKGPEAKTAFSSFFALVEKYIYDQNSPLRSEDLFLPFARFLSNVDFLYDTDRQRYERDARLCALNQTGSIAADFRFCTPDSHVGTLHEVKADWTLVFFSNPGCSACGQIIENLSSSFKIQALQDLGRLKILSIYIDDDLAQWRNHLGDYPDAWIKAYDPDLVLRDDSIYSIRAIPALYVLDNDKRVVLKDMPDVSVIAFFESLSL